MKKNPQKLPKITGGEKWDTGEAKWISGGTKWDS